MTDPRPAILITGASGGLASLMFEMLMPDYRLVGVDPRRMPAGRNFPGEFHQIDYTHRRMADLFRQNKFHALLHLGRIRNMDTSSNYRFNMNVLGTRNILELSRRHGVKNIIVFSTYHVYGAHSLNHLYITEEEPLRASQMYPELTDATELDHVATTFMWRYSDVRVVVLRPVNVVGRTINNAISTLLRSKFCPILMGYDPLMQFIHEKDVAKALKICLESKKSGVYNIAGEGAIPYSAAIEAAGTRAVPVPTVVAYPLVKLISRFGVYFPKHLVDYFRYPTVVSDAALRKEMGYAPDVTTIEALKSVRSAIIEN